MKAVPALVILLACGTAGAQVYKCREPGGKIVYSESKCEAGTRDLDARRLAGQPTRRDEFRTKVPFEKQADGTKTIASCNAQGCFDENGARLKPKTAPKTVKE